MQRFNVQGVVRDGQVILEAPLDLPDGTAVTVTDHDPEDVEVIGPDDPPITEVVKQLLLRLQKKTEQSCTTIRTGGEAGVAVSNASVLRRGLVDTPLLLLMLRGDGEAYQFAMDMLKVAAIGVSESSAMASRQHRMQRHTLSDKVPQE